MGVMQNDLMTKVTQSKNYARFIKILSIVAGVMILIGLISRYLCYIKLLDSLLITGFGLAAVVFYVRAFESPAGAQQQSDAVVNPSLKNLWSSNAFVNFSHKIFFWGLCVFAVGLLFVIMHWQGGKMMFLFGLISALMGLTLKITANKARSN